MKKRNDVKFIIYQALYIFVICVISIKGASLDLTQVIEDDGKPKVVMTPEEMEDIQQRLKTSVIVDTNNFVVVPKEMLKENDKLRHIVETMPRVDLNNYVLKSDVKIENVPDRIQDKIEEVEKKEEIVLGSVTLYKYHENSVSNQGNNSISVNGVIIPAHLTGRVLLNGEGTVQITAGNTSKTVAVLDNKKPQVSFQRMTSMGSEAKVTTLQRNIGYRVTITDDFIGQLDIKFSGAVSVKEVGTGVYDVTMNAFSSRQAFDNYIENKETPYSLGFTVTVKDRIAPHSVTGQNVFHFGEW